MSLQAAVPVRKTYLVHDPIPDTISNELNAFEPLLRQLLYNRGITNRLEALRFLNPNYEEGVHDPFLLLGMDRAVGRILNAIREKEHVAIYSDYDADGIPGAVLFHDFFKKIGFAHFENYIPSRHDEGFGLHKNAITSLKERGVSLIITIDCGITDVDEVAYARSLGIDVIVTDHHEAHVVLPDAVSIVNPKQPGCGYPDKGLCGAGVAFKLVQALLKKGDFNIVSGWEKWLLDMAGLATLSDMVPLTGENRILAHYGLLVLRKTPRPGLQQLLQKLKVRQRFLNEDDVGFLITPRINAASRMGIAEDAFALLSTPDASSASVHVEHLNKINDERKGVVAALAKEAHKIIKERFGSEIPKVLVLGNPEWRPSLLGLVANTLAEHYNVPVFLWGRGGDDTFKGSCRAPSHGGLIELMRAVPEGVFEDFGGHDASGGFSVSPDAIHHLGDALLKASEVFTQLSEPLLRIDAALSIADVNKTLLQSISKLAPFGVGNPKPVFLFERTFVEEIACFGKEKNHIKLRLASVPGGRAVEAIEFFGAASHWVNKISMGDSVAVAASVEQTYFKGFPELRLRIIDVLV